MCNKVDYDIKLLKFIPAKILLILLTILHAALGITYLVLFYLLYSEIKAINDPIMDVIAFAILMWGCALASGPILMSILIAILLCAKCLCLYIFIAIICIISDILAIKVLVTEERQGPVLITLEIIGVVLSALTIFAMIAIPFCGNGRSGGGVDDEENETESEVNTV